MGVTLERVQFKFASIIGELCSEPKILSQFAVWLDMRLAEFKLKGSISLDCSGEPTPPEWMQGMGEVLAANAVHQSRNVAPSSTEYSERGDEIIIEDSQIMSDSVHTTESFQSNCSRTADMNRKRSYPPWQADQLYQSTPKSARFLADHKDTESNQSLMSIIAETADSETSIQSPLSNDGPSFTITDTGGTKDFQEGNKLSQYYQPIQTSAQPTSSTQMNSNIYHRGMFYQPRERSVWSTEERCAIRSHLLPIVRRTKKPPTKADIQALMLREPSLRNRHWEKIKFQAWSLYQTLMRRQNSRRKAENSTETSDQNESEQKTSTCV